MWRKFFGKLRKKELGIKVGEFLRKNDEKKLLEILSVINLKNWERNLKKKWSKIAKRKQKINN